MILQDIGGRAPLFVHNRCRLGIPLPCHFVPHRREIGNVSAE
nr:MAG TPA: hypothetical protein [Caudoviricetes sp.]